MPVVEQAPLGEDVPLGAARTTLFRRDDDDAVGRVRPVQRRGGRPLYDLEVLDRLRVDVAQTTEIASAVSERRRAVVRRHADAVDDIDRVVVEAHAAHATHADALSRAGLPAGLHHHARYACVQDLGDIANRRVFHVGCDGVAPLLSSLLTGSGGYDLLQLHNGRCQGEVEGRCLPIRHLHRLLLLDIAHAQNAEIHRPGGDAPQCVLAVRS